MTSPEHPGRRAYAPKEVAALYGVNVHTVYLWLETGRLAGMKINTGPNARWRISPAALEAFEQASLRSRWITRDVAPPAFDCEHPDDGFQIECPICGALRTDPADGLEPDPRLASLDANMTAAEQAGDRWGTAS